MLTQSIKKLAVKIITCTLGCIFFVCANSIAQNNTPSDFYKHFPEWDQVVALKERLKTARVDGKAKADLLARFSELQNRHEVLLNGTDPIFQERREHQRQLEEHNNNAIKQRTEAKAIQAEVDATPKNQRTEEWAARMNKRIKALNDWADQVAKKKKDLDGWKARLDQKTDEMYKEWVGRLKEFIRDAETLLGMNE